VKEQMSQEAVHAIAGIDTAIERLDFDAISRTYQEQNEFLMIERFLAPEVVAALVAEAEHMRPAINRNYIPKHKKGGSVSRFVLTKNAPATVSLYQDTAFVDFLSRLAGARLLPCPPEDPHACALYFYTEPGDHIGFHYDTSYYKGARYTVLLG
jgi:alkylated DNA repair dioxygenase AlkB